MLYEVITSENVPFTFRVAGLGSRLLAWLIDLAALLALIIVGVLIGLVFEAGRSGLLVAFVLLWTFFVQWGYFLLFEWLMQGQTPGKRAMGIRVVDLQGAGISFGQSALRNVLRVVDGLPLLLVDIIPPLLYGVGFLAAASNRWQRRLGDLAAGTLVVHMQPAAKPRKPYAEQSGANRDKVSLRQQLEMLTRAQKETLIELCQRRHEMRFRTRARHFSAVADYFKTQFQLAPAEFESDERFVLNLAQLMGADVYGVESNA
jgi:uncharacterized RDD family membrane protein YckC